ncbi:hypothetical protein BH11CYA1_BH11CYA1_16770 [soil metagenome]
MCAADKPSELSNDGIVHDAAKQRAWRAAKLRQAIDNQTPSEIMEARTGETVARFGIDGLDGLDEAKSSKSLLNLTRDKAADLRADLNKTEQPKAQAPFTAGDIEALAKVISETVFLLPEQGLVFTAAQLAKELGITKEAMVAMTDEGYERLGLIQIRPYN